MVIDDSRTKRYGPKVEGANIHRNPTPGPADQEYLYWTPAVDLDLSPEPVEAIFPIRFVADNRHWLVPAGHHAIESPGKFDP